jgi:hypothetical protein
MKLEYSRELSGNNIIYDSCHLIYVFGLGLGQNSCIRKKSTNRAVHKRWRHERSDYTCSQMRCASYRDRNRSFLWGSRAPTDSTSRVDGQNSLCGMEVGAGKEHWDKSCSNTVLSQYPESTIERSCAKSKEQK